ncbi:MAG: hypothetical protein HUK01_02705 [Bacteroidaceae bacterium]|nr:hypothetical protein [Bacteroidaceae bacterium]
MKQKSIIYILLLAFTCGFSFSSCEDMLDVQSDRHAYETAQDTLYAYWGILKQLQNVGERYVLLGELRGDMVMSNGYDGEVSDSLRGIAEFTNLTDGSNRYLAARDYYAIINSCNAYIAAADTNRVVYGNVKNSKYMMREYAQVEAIRAWTYLQLVQLYGTVPFYLQPLTSTASIDEFITNPNHETVDRFSLPEKIYQRLGGLMDRMDSGELTYPQYDMYSEMVHSSYCFFPLHLVMGDIYLNANEYDSAARHYFAFLSVTNEGASSAAPKNADDNCAKVSKGHMSNRDFNYNVTGYDCFNLGDAGKRSAEKEAITVIPCTTNKLWGTVMRGVNEAFGFTSEVSFSGSSADTAATASVVLTPITEKRQFIASRAFERLCKSYPAISFDDSPESSSGMREDDPRRYSFVKNASDELAEPDSAGDGRYGWYGKVPAQTDGTKTTSDSCFIMKQNAKVKKGEANFAFSTTYPVIYRRSLVWLRFAEAINRAGFPEYAFAILRDGLYREYLPSLSSLARVASQGEQLYCAKEVISEEIPSGDSTITRTHNKLTLLEQLPEGEPFPEYYYKKYGLDEEHFATVTLGSDWGINGLSLMQFLLNQDESYVEKKGLSDTDTIYYSVATMKARLPYAPKMTHQNSENNAMTTCEYIPIDRMWEAQNTSYLLHSNFEKRAFEPANTKVRWGIHCKGCGYDNYRTIVEDTVYSFDHCMRMKWPADAARKYTGPLNAYTTSADVYTDYLKNLTTAVEDLIIDELALECCFEGHRYNDLLRFSTRDNRGAAWLKERIERRGTPANVNEGNKYLHLPTN